MRVVDDAATGCRLEVPAAWRGEASLDLGDQAEVLVRGNADAEGASVERLRGADPDDDLDRWVAVTFDLVGAPTTTGIFELDRQPAIHEWHRLGADAALAARWAVDEVRLHHGVLAPPGQAADGRRVYVALMRRGTDAWKVVLSLASAVAPGADDESVAVHDHSRAACTMATLAFA
jgi:hypothetical protein